MKTFKGGDYVQIGIQTLDTLLIDARVPIAKRRLTLEDLEKIEQDLSLQPCDLRDVELIVGSLRHTLSFVIASLRMDLTGGVPEFMRTETTKHGPHQKTKEEIKASQEDPTLRKGWDSQSDVYRAHQILSYLYDQPYRWIPDDVKEFLGGFKAAGEEGDGHELPLKDEKSS